MKTTQLISPPEKIRKMNAYRCDANYRVRLYRRHSWGPAETAAIIATNGGWHNPGSAEMIP